MRDTRKCVLCGLCGDGDTKGVARLLNLDVDSWIHLNCALWSAEVYETQVTFCFSSREYWAIVRPVLLEEKFKTIFTLQKKTKQLEVLFPIYTFVLSITYIITNTVAMLTTMNTTAT